jgi:hypothetical protein
MPAPEGSRQHPSGDQDLSNFFFWEKIAKKVVCDCERKIATAPNF